MINQVDASIPLQGINPITTMKDLASVDNIHSEMSLRQQQAKNAATVDQQNQLAVQQQKLDMADQQKLQSYMGDPTNQEALRKGDLTGIYGQVQPKTAIALQQHYLDAQKTAAGLDETTLKNNTARHDALQKGISGLLEMPEDQRPAVYAGMVQSMNQTGLSKGLDLPSSLPDYSEKSLNGLGGMNAVYHGIYKGAQENKTAAAVLTEQQQKTAGEATKNQTASRDQAAQELSGVSTQEEYAAWNAKHPELKAPPMMDPAFNQRLIRSAVPVDKQADFDIKQRQAAAMQAMTPESIEATIDGVIPNSGDSAALNARTKAQAKQAIAMGLPMTAIQAVVKDASDQIGKTETAVRTAQATVPTKVAVYTQQQDAKNTATAAANKPSDAALDMMAENVLAGGTPPGRNPLQIKAVYDRAAEMAASRGMTAQQAVLEGHAAKANTAALGSLTKQYEMLKPFGDMAVKNAAVLENAAKGVTDLGASFLNTPLRDLASKFGGTKTAAFNAALMPVQNDFARVLSSPTGAGQLSDSARHEMQNAISPGATYGQIKAALDVYTQDWQNRKATTEAAIKDLTGRTVSNGSQGNLPANLPPPPPPPPRKEMPKAGAVEGGWRFKGGNAADKNNWEKVQ